MSAKPVVPRELANQDVDDAMAYHLREAGDRTASGFVDDIEKAYRHISLHPSRGSSRYALELNLPGLRSWPLRGFPLIVLYLERNDCIDVWRVLQSARDIPVWLQEQPRG